MNAEVSDEIIAMIEEEAKSRPSSVEFEVAYQARVVIDRIKFAIRITELVQPQSDELREAGIQLLDALDRLDHIDRRFQTRLKPGQRHRNGRVGLGGRQR
jgi:hypothetical protein